MRSTILALLVVALAAADPSGVPDRLDVHAAVGVGGPSRAALFAAIKGTDDGRIRIAAGTVSPVPGGDAIAVNATDIADGSVIRDYTDRRRPRLPALRRTNGPRRGRPRQGRAVTEAACMTATRVGLRDVVALHGDPAWSTMALADLARPDSAVARVVDAARGMMGTTVGDHVVGADRVVVAVLPRGADDAGIRAALREARARSVVVQVAGARS